MPDSVYPNWKSVFDSGELSALTAICVAARPILTEALNEPREGGFPSGRPPKNVIRAAAWRVLQLTERDDSPRSLGRRAIAWMATTDQPLREDGEMDLVITHAQTAVESAQQAGDPLITAWALQRLGGAYGVAQRPTQAIETDLAALQLCNELELLGGDHWLYEEIPFLATSVNPGMGFTVQYRTLMHLASKYREVGDMLTSIDYANKAAAAARRGHTNGDPATIDSTTIAYPAKYAWALARRCESERFHCDTEAFLRTESELEQLASRNRTSTGLSTDTFGQRPETMPSNCATVASWSA